MSKISKRSGFSLVELLTVIAIIAILAAVIFPVMTTVKERARQNQCITNLHQIGVAVQAFKTDNRKYPLILGSKVNFIGSNPEMFENVKDVYLFPEYVKTIKMFHCPSSRTQNSKDVAVYDLTSPGLAVYAYDSYDAYVIGQGTQADGYVNYSEASGQAQRRYDTSWAVSADWVRSGSNLMPYPPDGSVPNDAVVAAQDYARQLKFRNPPQDTVVTWCSYHEGENNKGKSLVLFLDGSVDVIPANEMVQCKWRVRPKKS